MIATTAAAVRNVGRRKLALCALSLLVVLGGTASGWAAPVHRAARGCANTGANPSRTPAPPPGQNILTRRFREIGIGIAQGTPESGYPDGATYTTDFGARG